MSQIIQQIILNLFVILKLHLPTGSKVKPKVEDMFLSQQKSEQALWCYMCFAKPQGLKYLKACSYYIKQIINGGKKNQSRLFGISWGGGYQVKRKMKFFFLKINEENVNLR